MQNKNKMIETPLADKFLLPLQKAKNADYE